MKTEKIALIPAYEPDGNLLYVTEALTKKGYTVVIVNDGSAPSYNPVFSEAEKNGIVLQYEQNRGKGFALRYGLTYIRDHFDASAVIVTLDADGQHTPYDAGRIISAAWAHPGTLVLGCRNFDGDVPARSRFGNCVTRTVFSLLTGSTISDTQTGLRAFRYDMIDRLLEIPGDRYEYEMNVLTVFSKEHTPIMEIPIETIYRNNNASSHFHAVADSFRIYRQLLKYAGVSFISFLLDFGLYAAFSAVLAPFAGVYVPAVSNVAARVISACANYTMNRNVTFRDTGSVKTSAPRYAALAAGILLVNTALLYLAVNVFGIHAIAAKICVETLLFAASFLAQKMFVFSTEKERSAIRAQQRSQVLSHERSEWMTALASDRAEQARYYLQQ